MCYNQWLTSLAFSTQQEMYLRLTFIVSKEKGDTQYVSNCPELCVASQGDTIEDAQEMLMKAIDLLLESMTPEEIVERINEIGTGNPDEIIVKFSKEIEELFSPYLNYVDRRQDLATDYFEAVDNASHLSRKKPAKIDMLAKVPA